MAPSTIDTISIWGSIFTILGTIISILSAIIAYKQSLKAKSASKAASDATAFILERKQSIELMDLLKEIQNIERTTISYTINTKGRNVDKYTQSMQTLLSQLNTVKSKIDVNKPLRLELEESYSTLIQYVIEIRQNQDIVYQKCLEGIRVLIGTINKATNNNIYK